MNQPPRLAMMNSFAGFGRISTCVALPIISTLKVQVCPMPTAILSSHLGFPNYSYHDFTNFMEEYMTAWNNISLHFDGLYCGYLSNIKQIELVLHSLESTLFQDSSLILIDPVMGDSGKPYSTITFDHIQKMKQLIVKASLLTPNITEACLLTDTPYKTLWEEEELNTICSSLDPTKEKQIVITGIEVNTMVQNYIWDKGEVALYTAPLAGSSRHGTGDIFASILSADSLNKVPLTDSVKKASRFISKCIHDSDLANIPHNEGVLFEQNLSQLYS